MNRLILLFGVVLAAAMPALAEESIARIWNEENLAAIRIDRPHPPVQARNLFSVSAAMYDAWAAYDAAAVGYVYRGKHNAADIAAARHAAISYAAYRVLRERYALSFHSTATLTALDARFSSLGYDKNYTAFDSTPAGVGNTIAANVSIWYFNDGARQAQAYADYPLNLGGYVPINPPLVTNQPGTTLIDVNRWQRLMIENAVDQNGNPISALQTFQGPQWLGVRPFAHSRLDATTPWVDPGPPPKLGGTGDAQFREEVVEIIRRSSELTPDDGVLIDISPGVVGNNSLGKNDGHGHDTNPVTGTPYVANVVKRGDFARVLAEYWADGPSSETPPGHWNTIANKVGEHPSFVKRIGGTGPVLADLEWDVKIYFSLNSALHDAACAAWALKRFYDGGRPISFIRHMGGLGQSSDPTKPRYHPDGLPLIPDLIEQVTSVTTELGGRHNGLPVDAIVTRAWPGQPQNPATEVGGVSWIEATRWIPYQKSTFVTPGFPGYVSGHSTFSRSAAEVLTQFTGSPYFPGGLATHTATAGSTLTFEYGPSQTVRLQWATYFDAADQAGLSRQWGGIHVSVDDLTGRRVGAQCGQQAWALAKKYFAGTVGEPPRDLSIRLTEAGEIQLRCTVPRGVYYKLQTAPSLQEPFADEPGGFAQALNSPVICNDAVDGIQKFYRVVTQLSP